MVSTPFLGILEIRRKLKFAFLALCESGVRRDPKAGGL